MSNISEFDKNLLIEINNGLNTFQKDGPPGQPDENFKAILKALERLLDRDYIHAYPIKRESSTGNREIILVHKIFITDIGKEVLKEDT